MNTTIEHTIQCSSDGGVSVHVEIVHAEMIVPGLLIYQIPDHVEPDAVLRWRVGHWTGLAIASGLDEDRIRQLATSLAPLADWTQGTTRIRSNADRAAVQNAVESAHCVPMTPTRRPVEPEDLWRALRALTEPLCAEVADGGHSCTCD
ncbi:hypothetical protein ACGF07_25700 [Kitasatospora sp. NPDC048194]|uniref:hypothetical protein n=1 Tax=Kitasatospora sp. NPDC048194 TaxID=3364045 RepID=UPI0037100B83